MATTPDPTNPVDPYTALAAGYDVVMQHVDYEFWADYLHRIIQKHHPAAETLLELGCGTGSLALELPPLGPYQYLGTDRSEAMLMVARAKADAAGQALEFAQADFTNFTVEPPVDVIVLVYDGMNYLLEEAQIAELLRCAYAALAPGGLFIFDQSTPANSSNNAEYFDDEGEADAFRFVRRSRYDAETHLHTTELTLTVLDKSYTEIHVERAYTMGTVRALIDATEFTVAAAYDDFSLRRATPTTERIHWALVKG